MTKYTLIRRLLVFSAACVIVFSGCRTIQYVPVETVKEVRIKDSVYFRDTLIRIELEKARLSDFVNVGDTLVLSTDLACSTAFLDTTSGTLRGTLENIKKEVVQNVPLKEKIVYKDSVVTKEIPVPVEVEKKVKVVPWYIKIFAWIGFAAVLLLAGSLVWRFAKL